MNLSWRDVERLGAGRSWWDAALHRRQVPGDLRPVRRKFTMEQALRIALAAELVRLGVATSKAFPIIGTLEDQLRALTVGERTVPLHLVVRHGPELTHQIASVVPPPPPTGGQASVDVTALWARIRALAGFDEAAASPPAAPHLAKKPLAEPGTIGLFQDGLVVTFCDGTHAYDLSLRPIEAAGLALRLLQAAQAAAPSGPWSMGDPSAAPSAA